MKSTRTFERSSNHKHQPPMLTELLMFLFYLAFLHKYTLMLRFQSETQYIGMAQVSKATEEKCLKAITAGCPYCNNYRMVCTGLPASLISFQPSRSMMRAQRQNMRKRRNILDPNENADHTIHSKYDREQFV